jgi:hypothetical protein
LTYRRSFDPDPHAFGEDEPRFLLLVRFGRHQSVTLVVELDGNEFAPLLDMGDNDHFKGHCKAVVTDLQNAIFEVTNGLIGEFTGTPAMNIEAFITQHKAAFV